MATTPTQYTQEETFALVNQRALDKSDNFVVRVMRKRLVGAGAGLFDHVATLTEATVRQIASAETWLPRLVGGGEFGLKISHNEATHEVLGGYIIVPLRDLPVLLAPNIASVGAPDWEGPPVIAFPRQADVQAMQAQRAPTAATTVINGTGAAPLAALLAGAGAGAQQQVPAGYVPQVFAEEMARREKELTLREAALIATMKEKEDGLKRAELEQKLRAEAEATKRDFDAKLAALTAASAAPKAEPFSIDKIITALTPVLAAIMSGQASQRAEMLAMQQSTANQNAEMLKSMMNKPAISPEILTILEVNKAQSAAQADMMNHVFTAMQGVSKMSVQMIETVADLQLGNQPEGSPMLDAVREVVKGFGEMAKGTASGGRRVQQAAQQPRPAQLPQQVQVQPQQYTSSQAVPRPQPVPVQQYPQQPRQPYAQPQVQSFLQAAQGQPQQLRPAPQNGAPQVLVQPTTEPVPNQPQAFDGAPSQGSLEIDTDKPLPADVNALDIAEHLIRNRTQPVESVARFIIGIFKRPEVDAEMRQHDGEINSVIGSRLSDWLIAESVNRDYLGELGELVDKLGDEAGLFEPVDDDGDEQDAPAEEGSGEA